MTTREELTRQAEKCLRQGRLDEAIAQYQELAYLEPVDWGMVKQLADLLERASQREGAARQFARWADHLFAEGFHTKSAALYKKVLKLEPSDEHALWQLGEVSLEVNLRADARLAFQRVADLRQRRGDTAGAEAARQRLASFEITPTGLSAAVPPPPAYRAGATQLPVPVAAMIAAPARTAVDDVPVPTLAAAAVAAQAAPAPPPPESRAERLARLRQQAALADGGPDAENAWQAVLDLEPEDMAVRMRLVQAACDRGAFEKASALAASLDAAEAPALVMLVELAYRSGQAEEIDPLVSGRVNAGAQPDVVLAPVYGLAPRYPGAARAALASAVAAWTAAGQTGQAVAALEEAEARGLLTTALLLQWVEACVDADLPGLARAQHALAGAYVADRRFAEARAVAEDLFVREAGAEPARTLLLDILARDGVTPPDAFLAALLTPPGGSVDHEPGLDEGDDLPPWMSSLAADVPVVEPEPAPVTPSRPAWDDWVSGVLPAPVVPEPPPADATPSPAADPQQAVPVLPAPAAVFNWADLLGRDVDLGASPPGPSPEITEPVHAPAAPVDAGSPPPVLDAADRWPGALPEAFGAPPPADTAVSPLFGQFRTPSMDEGSTERPPFAMPRAWSTDLPAVPAADARHQRSAGDDSACAAESDPVGWAGPAVHDRETPDEEPAAEAATSPLELREQSLDVPDQAAETAGPPAAALVEEDVSAVGPRVEVEPWAASDPSPASHGADADPQWRIEEEIDLTQLLEELKQWDPVLPEPLVRPRPDTEPAAASGDAADREEPPSAAVADATWAAAVHVPPPDALTDAAPLALVPADGSAELDAVFADLHRRTDDRAVAEQQLAAGRVFLAAGLLAEAARAFERASAEPRARFDAALALAELHRSRGQLGEAVGWYEQAAAAAVPDAAVKRAVLYDLAESLEALGETDRALGVLLDLLSQVEDYRDARARLDRLLRVDAGG